jgi:phenylalanyl-tRNA synthetase alpha chain
MQYSIPSSIQRLLQQNIFAIRNHPLTIVKDIFVESFLANSSISNHNIFHDEKYIVSVKENFDDLLFEKEHVARSRKDTYYLGEDHLLRTHLTSREKFYISSGIDNFIIYGKVFRRDEIDRTHFPVFHQLEGVKLFHSLDSPRVSDGLEDSLDSLTNFILNDIETLFRKTLGDIFGQRAEIRFPSTTFPFTNPSFEAEVKYLDRWLEILGAGMLRKEFLDKCFDTQDHLKNGWAFGLGLERIAMILFNIPDIRWFWSKDERFLSQFQEGRISEFIPFSNHPPVTRDLSFWIEGSEQFEDNDIYELIRAQGGDEVESVQLVTMQ